MAKIKSTKRNQNRDEDASSKKKVNTGDNCVVGPWSNLNHHLLFLVLMKLGFVDYFSFGQVCKSWRSFAISNRKTFIASKPPMAMRVYWRSYMKEFFLEDSEGRKFKTILPHFSGGACVGLTSGYLIFYKRTTHDVWLVNPITRHELHFPDFPMNYEPDIRTEEVKAILVFSPSISKWVLVVMRKFSSPIWFSEENIGEWDEVSCTFHFTDICVLKGKIYTLNINTNTRTHMYLYELRLDPEPELKWVKTKNSLRHARDQQLVSSGENIYVMDRTPEDWYKFQELDFNEMKWMLREKKVGESAAFLSNFKQGVVDNLYFWGFRGQALLLGHNTGETLKVMELEKSSSFTANMWCFPHEFFTVDRLDE